MNMDTLKQNLDLTSAISFALKRLYKGFEPFLGYEFMFRDEKPWLKFWIGDDGAEGEKEILGVFITAESETTTRTEMNNRVWYDKELEHFTLHLSVPKDSKVDEVLSNMMKDEEFAREENKKLAAARKAKTIEIGKGKGHVTTAELGEAVLQAIKGLADDSEAA